MSGYAHHVPAFIITDNDKGDVTSIVNLSMIIT